MWKPLVLLFLLMVAVPPLQAQDSDSATGLPLCERTGQVRAAILRVVDASNCGEVTEAQLAAISELQLGNIGMSTLQAGDFSGLMGLTLLDLGRNGLSELPAGVFTGLMHLKFLVLNRNNLTALPAGVFDGLTELTYLRLDNNGLTALPEGVFAGLTALATLHINNNNLAELPAGAFADLTELEYLSLDNNNLTALPAELFAGLTALQILFLNNNDLTALPAGIFSDLSALTLLFLYANPGSDKFLSTANAGADQVVEAGQKVNLSATVGDVNLWGDNVSYAWTQTVNSGILVPLKDANTANPSFVMPAGTTALEFVLTVTGHRGVGLADTDSLRVRLPSTVVTLSGPVHDMYPADATAIAGDELSLVYSYSADDLRGRVLTGSIEVAASIDGVAITPAIYANEEEGVGEITVVLQRREYPDPGEHKLAVILSLSAVAEGFVLGGTSLIETTFSFLPLPSTVLKVRQAEGNQGKRGAVGSDAIELGYIFEYAADNRLNRPRAGLSVQVDVELCADAGSGCAILPGALQVLMLDGDGSLTLSVDRTLAALSVFGEADADSTRHGRVLLRTAGDADFAAAAAATAFSFAVADTAVTLSGPVPVDATGISAEELSLVYSYSADDLRGRALTGSIEVVAAIDGLAIPSAIEVDEDEGVGRITVVLQRLEYPEPGEHELAVILGLSAAAAGFVLGEPSSITTPFSFGIPAVADTVVTLSGPVHDLLPADATAIAGNELSLVYSYSADDLRGRALTGSIEVVAAIDGLAIPSAIEVDEDEGVGRITVVLQRLEYPEPGEHELAVILGLSAAAAGFVLGEPSSITTPFSFGIPAVADTVVTLSGPVHDLLPADATAIAGNELSLVYSYSADDLRGRVLTGSIEVAAAIDGLAITSAIEVDEDEGRGEITVVLLRREYPDPGEHELAVTLSLSAADAGFVLGEPSSITTPFSFGALVVADADTVVTLSGPVPAGATGISGEDLSLVYSYSADDLRGRTLMGNVDVMASVDGVAITPAVSYVDGARGEITIILSRAEYPEPDEHELAVTLSLSAADAGFVLAEPSSITTPFSFGALVVADADTVVTLSGPVPADATGISGEDLSLVYSYSADDLRGRTLMGNVDVVASVDAVAITPAVSYVDGVRGEITIILSRAEYPEPDEHKLAVTLNLSAAAAGFVLGEPSSITTPFSFGALVVADADTVVTLSGPVHDLLPADATAIAGDELSLVYSYSADDLRGRALTGSIEVAATVDGLAITSAIEVDEDEGRGEITVVLQRREYPGPGEHELAVTLGLSAAAAGFVLSEPSSITTPFSFGALVVADADTVVTLSGPVPADATGISVEDLSLVYSYSADDLRGRVLTGSIEVAASIDGVAITPAIYVNEEEGVGEITVVLQRRKYPAPYEHELAVALSLSAAAAGFVLGEPSSITTLFSFGALVVADADTVVTLSGPAPADATAISGEKLSLVYSCSADDLRGRVMTGNVEVVATVDGVAITPSIRFDEANSRDEITVVLQRQAYPYPGEHELAVALRLSATAEGFVLGESKLISTTFGFSLISTAIAEDGACQLGMLGPGEECLYRGSSYYLRVLETASGPQVFFFELNEVGEPLKLEDASNPHDPSDFRVYNLEAIREGRGYRIIRAYDAPAYSGGDFLGSLDGATILLAVLLFFAKLALGPRLAGAGGTRRLLSVVGLAVKAGVLGAFAPFCWQEHGRGAQNVGDLVSGACTGEVSAARLPRLRPRLCHCRLQRPHPPERHLGPRPETLPSWPS